MSAVRHTAIQRLANSASFSNRRISHIPTVHSSFHEDEKPIEINHFKQEKLAAGIRANEELNYIEAIKQFSLIKPDTPMSLYLCGCARLSMNYYYQIQEAIVDFTKCLELSSRTRDQAFILQVWYKLAQAYHRIQRYEDALRDYTEFIHRCESAGEQGENDLHRGFVARGQTYQALFELDKALKDMNRANQLTNDSNPYYLCCRASVYVWKDEKQKAEADLTKAAEIGYENNCEALLQRALVFNELDQHQAALENLEQAFTLARDPVQLAEISYRLGLTEYALNKKMQAIRSFEQAVNFHPFHTEAYFHLGKCQAEKGHHKQALKALNRAQDLAPQQPDILLERSTVHRALGNSDDANDDEKRATQLKSTSPMKFIQLIERIKKLRHDITENRSTASQYFELATMFDGLLNLKKRFKAKIEHYQDAVMAYRRCIDLDSKYQYPQARALLILCYQKMNGIIEAHELHVRFYDQMDEHPEALNRWKSYLVQITDKAESGQHETYLNETSVGRLIQIEFNRRKKDIDEEKLRNDTEDKHQSQLMFYRRLRLELSHLLASIAILNLDHEQIISANQQTSNQLERYIEVLKKNITAIDDIQSILIEGIYSNRKSYNTLDIQLIRMKLNGFANYIGDTIDYIDVSQLVARHLCTRYRSQLLCLNPTSSSSLSMIDLSTSSTRAPLSSSSSSTSSSSWWSCCKSRPSTPYISRQATSIDQSNIIERIATFAIAFVISSINRETNRMPSSMRTPRKDILATRIVLMISRAHHDIQMKYPLSIDQPTVFKMLQELPESESNNTNEMIRWDLYEFFRAPGIYCEGNEEKPTTYFYASGPSMKAKIYGYRLGTPEEIDTIRMKSSKKRF